MEKKIKLISLLLVIAMQIGACGQTGDLYLPDKKPQPESQMIGTVHAALR